MLNHPRGTTLERLSGWIRTTGGLPGPVAGPAPTAAEYFEPGGRQLGWEPLGRSTLGMACPGGHQAVSVDLPVGQASGDPGHGASSPSFGLSDHPAGPRNLHGPRVGKFYKSPNR